MHSPYRQKAHRVRALTRIVSHCPRAQYRTLTLTIYKKNSARSERQVGDIRLHLYIPVRAHENQWIDFVKHNTSYGWTRAIDTMAIDIYKTNHPFPIYMLLLILTLNVYIHDHSACTEFLSTPDIFAPVPIWCSERKTSLPKLGGHR